MPYPPAKTNNLINIITDTIHGTSLRNENWASSLIFGHLCCASYYLLYY